MSWKTAYRSFYYQDAPEPEDIVLVPAETALLVIDIQNTYMAPKPDPADDARWQPFFQRMRGTVIPNTAPAVAPIVRRHPAFQLGDIAAPRPTAVGRKTGPPWARLYRLVVTPRRHLGSFALGCKAM
jgi:hypothetical protein